MTFVKQSDFSRIDGSHIKKLEKGVMRLEASIDLHGFRLHEARDEFLDFVEECFDANMRYILVVTGKGYRSADGEAAIRNSVTNWINSDPLYGKVLAFCPAHKKHGGDGAFYILLKK